MVPLDSLTALSFNFKTTKDKLKRRESIAGKLNGWVLPIQSSTLALGNTQKNWTPGEVVLFLHRRESFKLPPTWMRIEILPALLFLSSNRIVVEESSAARPPGPDNPQEVRLCHLCDPTLASCPAYNSHDFLTCKHIRFLDVMEMQCNWHTIVHVMQLTYM